MGKEPLKTLVLKRKLLEALLLANMSKAALAHERESNEVLYQLFTEGRVIMAEYVAVIERIEKAWAALRGGGEVK